MESIIFFSVPLATGLLGWGITELLLRHGHVYYGAAAWTGKHQQWLTSIRFDQAGTQAAYEADAATPLDPDDLMKLAEAAYGAGHLEVALETYERAHAEPDIDRAATVVARLESDATLEQTRAEVAADGEDPVRSEIERLRSSGRGENAARPPRSRRPRARTHRSGV